MGTRLSCRSLAGRTRNVNSCDRCQLARFTVSRLKGQTYVSRAESFLAIACEACRRRWRSATEGMHGRLVGGQTVYVLQLVKAGFKGSASYLNSWKQTKLFNTCVVSPRIRGRWSKKKKKHIFEMSCFAEKPWSSYVWMIKEESSPQET